jgi:Protein of unknown function (DUF3465)
LKPFAYLAIAVVLIACGGRETADDQALHQAIVNARSGMEVTFHAAATDNPTESGGHERFHVRAATGEMLEIDHNTTLAPVVPFHKGDALIIHGELYIDPGPRYGVHCTHAQTSSGCPNPGWIEYADNYYE